MNPQQFADAAKVLTRDTHNASFVVRALIHCIDVIEAECPGYRAGTELLLDHLAEIQGATS
jgi:hypothetical protein